MKAIRVSQFGGPEVMTLADVPDLTPGAGQLVVAVRAAGVNPVDTYIRSGTYARVPTLPYTPGSDAAGDVIAVGPGVAGIKPGNRVYLAGSLSGTYAQQALCVPQNVHPLPERVTYAQGAGVYVPYATAYRALFQRAHAVAGETVFVHGASGGVGIAAVQIARAAGMRVIGTASTAHGLERVARVGAHFTLNHSTPAYLEQLAEITGGKGPDIILEMLANANLAKDMKAVGKYGRIVVIGSRGPVEIDARDAMARDASILGMSLANVNDDQMAAIHPAILAGLENGSFRPIVGSELPLAQAARAHSVVMEPGSSGKIVLVP